MTEEKSGVKFFFQFHKILRKGSYCDGKCLHVKRLKLCYVKISSKYQNKLSFKNGFTQLWVMKEMDRNVNVAPHIGKPSKHQATVYRLDSTVVIR